MKMPISGQHVIKTEKNKRKSKMEILESIKNYIECKKPLVFNKSSMLDNPWNLDPRTVEEFLQIVHFCQNQFPRIRIHEKDGKKMYQQLDYQSMKQEMKDLSLEEIGNVVSSYDIFNPKVFPVFKCKKCGVELGYPSHHNEPMIHKKNSGELICAFRECEFTQKVPMHHTKRMDIYVKYSERNKPGNDQKKKEN